MGKLWGLPIYEIIIPIICWTIFLLQYLYLYLRGAFTNSFQSILSQGTATPQPQTAAQFPFLFFSKARQGWVTQNFLTGQASANSTRYPGDHSVAYLSQRLSSCDPFLRWQCRRFLPFLFSKSELILHSARDSGCGIHCRCLQATRESLPNAPQFPDGIPLFPPFRHLLFISLQHSLCSPSPVCLPPSPPSLLPSSSLRLL
jgi:hypothetical protein